MTVKPILGIDLIIQISLLRVYMLMIVPENTGE
jgi:hypothetical protein